MVKGANIRRIEARLGEDEAKRGLNGDKNVVGAQNGVRSSRLEARGMEKVTAAGFHYAAS